MRGAAIGGVALIGLALAAGTAVAQGERASRYTMSPAEGGGFVRLDSETGQMALCQRRDGEWSCREMAEPGRGLDQALIAHGAPPRPLRAQPIRWYRRRPDMPATGVTRPS